MPHHNMLRLFVLLTAVVCCNAACRQEMLPTQDTTNSPQGCADSAGKFHEFYTEWEDGHETCVCVQFACICCERFEGHWGMNEHDYITVGDEGTLSTTVGARGDSWNDIYGDTQYDDIRGNELHDYDDSTTQP